MSNSTIAGVKPYNFNIAMVKSFCEDRRTTAARRAIKSARKAAAEIRAKVDAYEAPIFAEYEFYNDLDVHHGSPRRRLTRIGEIYLSEDEVNCAKFYAACTAAHAANGFPGLGEKCPALCAENKVIELENALIAWGSKFFNFDFTHSYGDLRKRAIKLFLGE